MVLKIESDYQRFRNIVRGKIRKELKKYMSTSELIGRKGKNLVSIPLPQIDLPHFKYGSREKGGVGSGDGEVGQPIGNGDGAAGNNAGNAPGEHILEVDVSLEELAKILGEELELPRIEPRGNKEVSTERTKYTGINKVGPESLKHFKRSYKQALRRQVMAGIYNPQNPQIIPVKEDMRYRTWKVTKKPESNAAIFYIMDVSGSMGDEQKEIVRIESFWIDTWLRSQYKGVDVRYIIHDAVAREVDERTFYHTRESGGTVISSAYKLCHNIISADYNSAEWNIYPFQFSDGDNWSGDDTTLCVKLLHEALLPVSNMFCYGQVESQYGSGQFIKDLRHHFPEDERIILSKIDSKEGVYDSIKTFLGKGK